SLASDLLLLAGALVLSLDLDNPVGIDVEGHLDLGYPARRRWKADEIELSEQLVVRRHLALALEHTDGYGALVVFGGGENLALFRGNSGVAIDQPREDAAQRLDAERERSDVEEQHVLDVALEDTGLNRRTHRDDLIGIDALVRLFAEQLLDDFLHLGHAGHAADQHHLIDLRRREPRVFERDAARLDRLLNEVI